MEQSKYYTPDIQEFKIGFECEFFNNMQDKQWNKVICDQDHIAIAYTCFEEGTKEWEDDISQTFRVKYLDDKDIEECGFTCLEVPEASDRKWSNEYVFVHKTMSNRYLRYNIVTHGMLIDNNRNMENHIRWFDGKVNNKSELKVLLKQLGIE